MLLLVLLQLVTCCSSCCSLLQDLLPGWLLAKPTSQLHRHESHEVTIVTLLVLKFGGCPEIIVIRVCARRERLRPGGGAVQPGNLKQGPAT